MFEVGKLLLCLSVFQSLALLLLEINKVDFLNDLKATSTAKYSSLLFSSISRSSDKVYL